MITAPERSTTAHNCGRVRLNLLVPRTGKYEGFGVDVMVRRAPLRDSLPWVIPTLIAEIRGCPKRGDAVKSKDCQQLKISDQQNFSFPVSDGWRGSWKAPSVKPKNQRGCMTEYTEHHKAEPLLEEPIVQDAVSILKEAMNALGHNGHSYNGKGIGLADYNPHGIQSFVDAMFEPLARTFVSGKKEQARDYLGYAALFLAWVRAGCPEGKLAPQIRKHAFEIHMVVSEIARREGWDTKGQV